MVAEIITIGTEVVMGSILNTNSFFLSQKLIELGIEVHFHTSVDDNEKRLESIIKTAISRADLIITTGGLGPTKDDMTKEIIAKALGLNIELDKTMENNIIDMFTNGNWVMTDNNQKQAFKPTGSKFIENTIGTAPGIYIEKDSKKIIMLPGPPVEMELMFEKGVINLIKDDLNIITRSINLVGIGESSLESKLNNLNLNSRNFSVLTFAKKGVVEIKIIAKGKDKNKLEEEIINRIEIIKEEFNDYIYSYDSISLEEVIIDLLNKKRWTLAVAESITGGIISSKLTKIAGASSVFNRGLITYSNTSKIEELGVKKESLNKYGPVSKETAYEMAKGLFLKSNVDIALSITGLAGPGGGTQEKPIGLVYIGIITNKFEKVFKYNFNGNRNLIQERAAVKALDEIRKLIKQ
ncbi:competence/damage-inducible protein A [Tissierella creatinophila]|uniref:Putative competence-damage inducible protein n=1 Tax=Tissierella creatinophila DSM 6911 TaxID=1123403 RepID=A0A1U7M3B6_TISCR|nr:competence/damage-inducible protein A [Tissierella creatinophila]OLS01776.1 putative competence-damage inducible protein [Tissierella creatinophila DSM 6911]